MCNRYNLARTRQAVSLPTVGTIASSRSTRFFFAAFAFDEILDGLQRFIESFLHLFGRWRVVFASSGRRALEGNVNGDFCAVARFFDLHPAVVIALVGAPFQTKRVFVGAKVAVAVVFVAVSFALNANATFALRLGALGRRQIFGQVGNVGDEIEDLFGTGVHGKRRFKVAVSGVASAR